MNSYGIGNNRRPLCCDVGGNHSFENYSTKHVLLYDECWSADEIVFVDRTKVDKNSSEILGVAA